ncbi:hypothetical protein [Metamycoplasma neophronis]|uniref:DUF3899 domain-containing protein n=1 Tax=Metamycoplasma neophronis TaxID=872983 RepID=A0ABY2YZ79_9BACT|nr:hypothetical protein [Metamycoplasma neophronis]TPR53266.1 hypothetical protein FJR74_02885 [Metamycoplasma neophronis]
MSKPQFAESKARAYWRNGWNVATIVYFVLSIILAIALIMAIRFGWKGEKQKDWQTSISIIGAGLVTINLLIVLVRKGLGKNIYRFFSGIHRSRVINSRAKEHYRSGMSQFEKDKILNRVRRDYDIEENKKAKEKKYREINNLSFFLLIGIGVLMIIALIPVFVLKLKF